MNFLSIFLEKKSIALDYSIYEFDIIVAIAEDKNNFIGLNDKKSSYFEQLSAITYKI